MLGQLDKIVIISVSTLKTFKSPVCGVKPLYRTHTHVQPLGGATLLRLGRREFRRCVPIQPHARLIRCLKRSEKILLYIYQHPNFFGRQPEAKFFKRLNSVVKTCDSFTSSTHLSFWKYAENWGVESSRRVKPTAKTCNGSPPSPGFCRACV